MEIPYTVKPRPDTGLYNAKLGIWLFLASEVMLFGALFSSYVLLRVGAEPGTWSMGLMDITVGAGNTMVLIASSMFVVLAWACLKQGDLVGYRKWKLATLACAALFLMVKWSYEWPAKFKHHDVWFKHPTVLHAAIEDGYGPEALHQGHNEAHDVEEENKAHSHDTSYGWTAAQEYLHGNNDWEYLNRKATYAGRFFKRTSPESAKAYDKGLKGGTLALSGHITGYREMQINVTVSAWNADRGSPDTAAEKVLADLNVTDAKDVWMNGGTITEKTDYNNAMQAKHRLEQAGFTVELSENGYNEIKETAWFWRTPRANELIDGKPRVESFTFELDNTHEKDGSHRRLTIKTIDVKRLSAYEPKHSTFFGIYYTITGLHAAHVFGGIIIMIYNLLPIGLLMWGKDRERFTNRIETFGLFWHFVDLVWIFLFPILYIL